MNDVPGSGRQRSSGPQDLGSAAQEAVRLLEAAGQWLYTRAAAGAAQATPPGPPAAGPSQDTGDTGETSETGHTGGPECQHCPLCRGLASMREMSPQAREHFLQAGAAFVSGVSALLETVRADAAPDADHPADQPGPERIRVD